MEEISEGRKEMDGRENSPEVCSREVRERLMDSELDCLAKEFARNNKNISKWISRKQSG
jgi:hypothetical protein